MSLIRCSICFYMAAIALVSCDCPNQWLEYKPGNKCFLFVKIQKNFTDNLAMCKSLNATLASIHSADQNEFIRHQAFDYNDFMYIWIGLQLNGSNYTWSDGSPSDYSNWGENEPDKSQCVPGCAVEMRRNGSWYDYKSSQMIEQLCQLTKTSAQNKTMASSTHSFWSTTSTTTTAKPSTKSVMLSTVSTAKSTKSEESSLDKEKLRLEDKLLSLNETFEHLRKNIEMAINKGRDLMKTNDQHINETSTHRENLTTLNNTIENMKQKLETIQHKVEINESNSETINKTLQYVDQKLDQLTQRMEQTEDASKHFNKTLSKIEKYLQDIGSGKPDLITNDIEGGEQNRDALVYTLEPNKNSRRPKKNVNSSESRLKLQEKRVDKISSGLCYLLYVVIAVIMFTVIVKLFRRKRKASLVGDAFDAEQSPPVKMNNLLVN